MFEHGEYLSADVVARRLRGDQSVGHGAAGATRRMRGEIQEGPTRIGVDLDQPRSFRRDVEIKPWKESGDRKSTRLNSSHSQISYAVFCLKTKNNTLLVPPVS